MVKCSILPPKRVYCRSIPLGKCDKNYATFRDDRPKKLEPKRSTIQSKSKEQEHAPKIQELYIIYIYIYRYIHLTIYVIIIVTKKDFPSCPIALSEQLKFLVATASWPFSAPHSPDIDRSMCEITVTRLSGPENK